MNKQQKILMSAERAIKRLVNLSKQISNDALADWMIQSDKLGQFDADNLWFVATWLGDVCEPCGVIPEYVRSKPHLACVVCGKESHRLEARGGTRAIARIAAGRRPIACVTVLAIDHASKP